MTLWRGPLDLPKAASLSCAALVGQYALLAKQYALLAPRRPLTYLEPTGESQTLRVDDATFTVIDVRPSN